MPSRRPGSQDRWPLYYSYRLFRELMTNKYKGKTNSLPSLLHILPYANAAQCCWLVGGGWRGEYALCVSHVRLLYALRRALLSLVVSDKINEAVACYLYFSSFLSYLGFLFVCFKSNYFKQRLRFYKSVLRIIQKRGLTMFMWIRWVTPVGSHR